MFTSTERLKSKIKGWKDGLVIKLCWLLFKGGDLEFILSSFTVAHKHL